MRFGVIVDSLIGPIELVDVAPLSSSNLVVEES